MPTLSASEISETLSPYAAAVDEALISQLSIYLDLLLKWNVRTNLTAIREPREIVRRHFGESLFAAQHLGQPSTLLDYGSGAGFPGIPIALARPDIRVTLAESQNKKASFLREAIRCLNIPATVWASRAEEIPSESRFDCVTLRAVDKMVEAIDAAQRLSSESVVILTTRSSADGLAYGEFQKVSATPIPGSVEGVLIKLQRKMP